MAVAVITTAVCMVGVTREKEVCRLLFLLYSLSGSLT